MKYVQIIIIFLIPIFSFGQSNQLRGTWITDENELIYFRDFAQYPYLLSNSLFDEIELDTAMIINDTLRFQKKVWLDRNYDSLVNVNYDFRIIENTNSMIKIQPLSNLSIEYFKQNEPINFVKQEFAIDSSLKFEKIIYHSISESFYSKLSIQIDSSRNVFINARKVSGYLGSIQDTAMTGNFVGKINNKLYDTLLNYIYTCNLRSVQFNDINSSSLPIQTFIIYYNGKRKYLKTVVHPAIFNKLSNYLFNLQAHLHKDLMKVEEELKFEK